MGARVESAAAKDARPGTASMICGRHQLQLRLYRTGASHGDKFASTDLQMQLRDHCLLAPRALQNVGGFGKSFFPTITHAVALQSGEMQDYP